MTALRERVRWRTAAPLWAAAAEGELDLGRPAILRFASDDFMDRVQAVLDGGGAGLDGFLARDETWSEPQVGLPVDRDLSHPLRLYQPLQGRFYLVSATLVCSRRGLPDRMVDPAREESAFFVLRQLRPIGDDPPDPRDSSTFTEYAWIPGAAGAGAWQPAPAAGLAQDERRLPLFGVSYEALGARRRLLAGLIPVGAREGLRSAPAIAAPVSNDPFSAAADPRLAALLPTVIGLQAIQAEQARGAVDDMREALYFAALDVADFLAEHLPRVWAETTNLPGAQGALVTALGEKDGFAQGVSWFKALKEAHPSDPAEGPTPLFQGIAAAEIDDAITQLGVDPPALPPHLPEPANTKLFKNAIDALAEEDDDGGAASLPAEALSPEDAHREEDAVLVARCIYERPHCPPGERLRVSPASAPFVFASLYDPDGPVRPAHIPTPNDIDLATLRRTPKGVALTLSAELRRQIERFQVMKISDLEKGPPDDPGLSIGMVCQLSIPIITICALILLMIIVSLLNIVFWWLPFFKICVPSARRG